MPELTSRYIPLNGIALHEFSKIQTSNYIDSAFICLLLYDHVITLDKEIEWIWTFVKRS